MRVYIIDECHMLSAGANNALLKTLEEPPAHVLFILATTELHKVPATILSRCQSFTFKRLQPGDIATRLMEIAAGEKIPLEEAAAELISRLADGALRDAISMLDQCAATTSGPIGTEQVLSVLGLAGSTETLRLAKAVADRDAAGALALLADMYANGKEISSLLGELSAFLRDLLVYSTTGSFTLVTGNYDKDAVKSIQIEKSRLVTMVMMLQDALGRMQRSQNRRVDAELCLIGMCDETLSAGLEGLAARVERLEKRPPSSASARSGSGAGPGGADAPPWDVSDRSGFADRGSHQTYRGSQSTVGQVDSTGNRPNAGDNRSSAGVPRMNDGNGTPKVPTGGKDFWQEILQAIRPDVSMSQYSYLATMKTPILQGNRLRIVTESTVAQNILNKPELLSVIDREAAAILGGEVRSDVVPAEKLGGEGGQATASGSDKLDRLIQRGNKLNNITVE